MFDVTKSPAYTNFMNKGELPTLPTKIEFDYETCVYLGVTLFIAGVAVILFNKFVNRVL